VLGANFDFDKATRAHVEWKHRLHACIKGNGEKLDVATVSSDNRCPLGEWIYGAGKNFASHAEHEILRTSHAGFHRCAGQVLKLTQAGQFDAAEEMLNAEFEAESKKTVEKLYAMRGVVEKNAAAARQQASVQKKEKSPFGSRAIGSVERLRQAKVKAVSSIPQRRTTQPKAVAGGDWTEF
jgi:methyl-accepting chemotaxis protein